MAGLFSWGSDKGQISVCGMEFTKSIACISDRCKNAPQFASCVGIEFGYGVSWDFARPSGLTVQQMYRLWGDRAVRTELQSLLALRGPLLHKKQAGQRMRAQPERGGINRLSGLQSPIVNYPFGLWAGSAKMSLRSCCSGLRSSVRGALIHHFRSWF